MIGLTGKAISIMAVVAGAMLLSLIVAARADAASGPANLKATEIGSFSDPVGIVQPPGKTPLLVVEQTGKIKARTKAGWKTFLDLSNDISCCGEQGLLGLAFPPDYQRTRRFYVNYTDRDGDTRIVEFKRAKGTQTHSNGTSRRQIMRIDQPYSNHNGGSLAFDRNGSLYIGLGDGGSGGDPENRAQNLNSKLGKILRINPKPKRSKNGKRIIRAFSVPRSNPFVGRAGDDTIYSYGLRNPWRFSIDYSRGDGPYLVIGDVGQNDWEEVDYLPLTDANGANFGWSRYEGFQTYDDSRSAPDAIFPIHVYSHSDGRCSITGGHVVSDPDSRLYRRYLYADFCAGTVRSFIPNGDRAVINDRSEGLNVGLISSFGVDRAGRSYVSSLNGGVYRIDEVAPARLQVQESEWDLTLSRAVVEPGQVIVEAVNNGEDPHDLKLVREGSGEEPLDLGGLTPGEIRAATFGLAAGSWKLYCSLPGHEALGMSATLAVTG